MRAERQVRQPSNAFLRNTLAPFIDGHGRFERLRGINEFTTLYGRKLPKYNKLSFDCSVWTYKG